MAERDTNQHFVELSGNETYDELYRIGEELFDKLQSDREQRNDDSDEK